MNSSRTSLTIFGACGNIGGFQSVLQIVFCFIFAKFSKLEFQFEAINSLFDVKSRLEIPDLNIFHSIRLLTNICPNNTLKTLLKFGLPQLTNAYELVHLLDTVHH